MNIAFFVNHVGKEGPTYATTGVAAVATRLGHSVWYIDVDGFACDPDDRVRARARKTPEGEYVDGKAYLEALQSDEAPIERITVADLDVLMLRNNPAEEEDAWPQAVGVTFGEAAKQQGVLVLNDPDGLWKALNKLYFQSYPRCVRPLTLITRDADEIKHFVAEQESVVLKPLQGYGGADVFLVNEDQKENLNQIIDTILRDGYLVAQEYLPAAADGDIRLFLMNGAPLIVDGHYAAMHRVRSGDDMRSNLSAGGKLERAEITDAHLELAAAVAPKLRHDGIFLAGIDIAGDKLMEVNVFSPGGLPLAEHLEDVEFCRAVVAALEEKIEIRRRYPAAFSNRELATM